MNGVKERRQRALADLIRSGALSSQDELVGRLSELGFAVTQATISRDLEQIGAVKVRRDGQLSYAMPDEPREGTGRLGMLMREFVRSIDTAGNLVVIRTPPGSAHLIGVALDQAQLSEIVGTICGDDTIFIACSSAKVAAELATRFRSESGRLQ